MYIENGITLENGRSVRCSKCSQSLAILNDKGQLILKKVSIAYISVYEGVCEAKCSNCGTFNAIDKIT